MEGTIINLSDRPVSIRLNTGQTRHIPPRSSLAGIRDVEVKHNPRIRKLLHQRMIALDGIAYGPRSGEMRAAAAIAHIENSPLVELQGFLSSDEDRVTVLRAWQRKQHV